MFRKLGWVGIQAPPPPTSPCEGGTFWGWVGRRWKIFCSFLLLGDLVCV